jgi:hypothetical protein
LIVFCRFWQWLRRRVFWNRKLIEDFWLWRLFHKSTHFWSFYWCFVDQYMLSNRYLNSILFVIVIHHW